jgi:hypothetical protein
MELLVSQNNHIIAHAITDNPYQARNFILPHLTPTHQQLDEHSILTAFGLLIKTTPEISPLLNSTPRCINEVPFSRPSNPPHPPEPPKQSGLITLRAICLDLELPTVNARRILRKHYGAQNIRYEWPFHEVATIIKILRSR